MNYQLKQNEVLSKFLDLVYDSAFVQFEQMQTSPSIFNAVGRTYTETWHSALFGWLLDPLSSHNLKLFPLMRLLLLLKDKNNVKVQWRGLDIGELLTDGDFSKTTVSPNERKLDEIFVPTVGRFDVFVDGIYLESEYWTEIKILIEMKMKAGIDIEQNNRYMNYIDRRRRKRELIIPVYIAPHKKLSGIEHPEKLFGNLLWLGVSYQDITSYIIEPCLKHPDISEFGKYSLREYLKTLKYLQQEGEVMAITQEEREIVGNLYDQHRDAIHALYQILSDVNDEFEPLSVPTKNKEKMKIIIGDVPFEAYSVRDLYQQVLKFLVEGDYLNELQLPFVTSSKRYLLATTTVHQTGKEFIAPVEYSKDGITYYMEANKSRLGAIRDLSKLSQVCGLSLEVIS